MNLHSIPFPRHPLSAIAEYLQFRYGWIWRPTQDGLTVEFRTDESANWISLSTAELDGYDDDFRRWQMRNPGVPFSEENIRHA